MVRVTVYSVIVELPLGLCHLTTTVDDDTVTMAMIGSATRVVKVLLTGGPAPHTPLVTTDTM